MRVAFHSHPLLKTKTNKHKPMKKNLFLLLALLIAGSGFAQKAPTTKLVSSTENQIIVNVQLNGYSTQKV